MAECAARLAARDGRAGREDRSGGAAAGDRTSTTSVARPYDGAAAAIIAGWDVALLPFALNEATRFISPTKTPEYLAAGRPVVSTSIRDVISPYGERELVYIADTVTEMVRACNAALREPAEFRRTRADAFLSGMSWDRTWSRTAALLDAAIAPAAPQPSQTARAASGV